MILIRLVMFLLAAGSAAKVAGCSQATSPSLASPPTVGTNPASILVGSSPAAGSTISDDVEDLVLRFSPAARLDEVTVSGPQGKMPMMINSPGQLERYSLPIQLTGPGTYTVDWRATARGQEYRGTFEFKVAEGR